MIQNQQVKQVLQMCFIGIFPKIGFLIHFSDWNLFPFISIYSQLGNISGNVSGNISGNISRGINSREFNNPSSDEGDFSVEKLQIFSVGRGHVSENVCPLWQDSVEGKLLLVH